MRACPHCLSVYVVDAEHCSVDGEKLGGPAVLRGKVLADYIFEDLIGIGGTGCVYRGRTRFGERCAIKLLFREMAVDDSLIERFRREAEAVSAMDHPNVVRIFGHGTTSADTVFIAMEFLEGKTLKDILEADAPLQPARAGRIAEQMASGLGEAHRLGFVHRDLKPGNIMICRDRFGQERVKLLDFGIVASLKERGADDRLTKTGYIVGTPTYMAPEQIDPKQVGPQVDVYALGVMLYEMLCGQPPFRGTLEQILVAKMTSDPTPIERGGELGQLALRFLEKDPEKRPRNALQASAQLGKLSLMSDDPATVRAELPDFPTYGEVGAAPSTVRFTEWDSEVTKPPRPAEVRRKKDKWTADTRRIDFESEAELNPATTVEESGDLIPIPHPRPDTLIDGIPAAMLASDPNMAPLSMEATDADVEVPTQIGPTPDSLFRDTDEDMPVPEVTDTPPEGEDPASGSAVPTEVEEPADQDALEHRDTFDAVPSEDDVTAGEEDTHLQFNLEEPPEPPATKAAPPAERPQTPFPVIRMIAYAVLLISLLLIAAAFAFDLLHTETVIIDVPRE